MLPPQSAVSVLRRPLLKSEKWRTRLPPDLAWDHAPVGITAVKCPLMGDGVEEIGLKWWMRYVIVPVLGTVLGGGGLVAIWISMREHPDVTTSNPERPSTTPRNPTANSQNPTQKPPLQEERNTNPLLPDHGDVIFVGANLNTAQPSKINLTAKVTDSIFLKWEVKNLPADAYLFLRQEDEDGIDTDNRKVDAIGSVDRSGGIGGNYYLEEERHKQRTTLAKIVVKIVK